MAKSAEARVQPRKLQYHEHHPMREDDIMPHNMDADDFTEYLILQGMTEEGYWLSVQSGQEQAEEWEQQGVPIQTDKLTHDQKGWARADHFDHYQREMARWHVIPGKESRVVPAHLAFQIRDRVYRDHCDDDNPKYVLWGYRWDLRPLHQCTICGEVIVKPPRTYNNTKLTDDKEQHDEAEATDLELPGEAA